MRTRSILPTSRRLVGLLGVTALTLGLTAASASAAAPPHITGMLPAAAASDDPATVYVLKQPAQYPAKTGARVTLPVIASGQVDSGSRFTLATASAMPFNAIIVATSHQGTSVWFAPVNLTSGTANVGRLPAYSAALLRHSTAGSHVVPNSCVVTVQQTADNVSTRVGELHVANASNVTGTYTYTGQADSTFTVGSDATGTWQTSGTSSVTNSGAGGNVSSTGGTTEYTKANYKYQLFLHSGTGCPSFHTQQATAWDGNVAAGGSAPSNPWGNCASDPHGDQSVANGNTFTVSGGASVNYSSGVANPFGSYSFGDQTGYSSNVKIKWQNNSGHTVFLCGSTGKLTGVIYNDNN